MPYIPQEMRPACEALLDEIEQEELSPWQAVRCIADTVETAGERNYCWMRWIIRQKPQRYHEHVMLLGAVLNATIGYRDGDTGAAIVGDAICMIEEYYRRVMVKYERTKIAQNGDVEGLPSDTV